jgi:hypothetical protein
MANHTFPKISAFTANIPFDQPYTELSEHTITGPLNAYGKRDTSRKAVIQQQLFSSQMALMFPTVSAFSLLRDERLCQYSGQEKSLYIFLCWRTIFIRGHSNHGGRRRYHSPNSRFSIGNGRYTHPNCIL